MEIPADRGMAVKDIISPDAPRFTEIHGRKI
jgi:hypothetical protein